MLAEDSSLYVWERDQAAKVVRVEKEILGLSVLSREGLCILLVVVLAAMATGCAPRGAMANPGWTTLTADNGAVYAALSTGRVVALDAATGDELWSYPLQQSKASLGCSFARTSTDDDTERPLDAVYGIPALTDDLVLVASYDHHLYAFERSSGRKVWDFAAGEAVIGGATVYDGVVYFGASDYRVYALDATTGEPVWDAPFATGHWVWGAPAVDEETVYAGSMDHHVYAIDRQAGLEKWRQEVGGSVPGSVTLADGMLFVGSVDKHLYALRASDGAEVWKTDMGHWVWGEALAHDGYVYACSLDGKAHALALGDGSPRWEPFPVGGAVRAGPALLGGDLVVGTESGAVYRIDMETGHGEKLLTTEKEGVLSTPAVVDETMYVGTTAGRVWALDTSRSARAPIWTYPPPKE